MIQSNALHNIKFIYWQTQLLNNILKNVFLYSNLNRSKYEIHKNPIYFQSREDDPRPFEKIHPGLGGSFDSYPGVDTATRQIKTQKKDKNPRFAKKRMKNSRTRVGQQSQQTFVTWTANAGHVARPSCHNPSASNQSERGLFRRLSRWSSSVRRPLMLPARRHQSPLLDLDLAGCGCRCVIIGKSRV